MEAAGWLRQWEPVEELQAGRMKESDHSDEHREFRAPLLRMHTEIKAFGCILMLFMFHAVHADIVMMRNATEQHDSDGIRDEREQSSVRISSPVVCKVSRGHILYSVRSGD